MSIIEPPVIPNQDAIVQIAIESLQQSYPNFAPNAADPMYRVFVAFAGMVAEAILLFFEVPEAIIRYVGAVVYQTPPRPGTQATCTAKVKCLDSNGHEIEAGEIVNVTSPTTSQPIAFEVVNTVVITKGSVEGTVELRAVEVGSEGNMAGLPTATFQEPLAFVESVTLTTSPSGGTEEETTEEYAQRIVELATLIAPRPILPNDFANFVRLLVTKEKMGRCLAIDQMELKESGGHTEVNGSGEGTVKATGVERCCTVIATNAEGKALSTAAREQAEEILKAARETTFKVFVAGPTINTINVTVTGKYFKGYTEAGVKAEVEAALKALLSPINWGQPKEAAQTGNAWRNKTVLRRQDVIRALDTVAGFNFFTNLKINGTEAEEYVLSGIAPLCEAGVLAINLTEGTE